MITLKDAGFEGVLLDFLQEQFGLTHDEAESTIESFKYAIEERLRVKKQNALAARKLPKKLKYASEEAIAWCEANGGHVDRCSFLYAICETCGISDA